MHPHNPFHHHPSHPEHKDEVKAPVAVQPPAPVQAPVTPPQLTVTDEAVSAAYNEFIHPRNSLGDGCPGCGYGHWWGQHQLNNNKHFHLSMLRNVLEAAKGMLK